MKEDMLAFIKSRRSTRKFKQEMIPDEQLMQILEAGQYAPSGGNCQYSHLLVIKNKEVLAELAKLAEQEFAKMDTPEGMYKSKVHSINAAKKGNYIFHYNPSALILVANKNHHTNAIADVSCCLENMMIMANALDLGSVWINQIKWLRHNEVIVDFLRKIGMEEGEAVYGGLAVGYPDTPDGLPFRTPGPRTGNKITIVE